MAREYDSSNEVSENIALIQEGSKGNKISITSINQVNKPGTKIDIRRMYTKDGELKHSTQGVRFNSELTVEIILGLLKTLDDDKRQDLILGIERL